ncbi:NlpC/P60 family protein [Nocardioides sp. WV_118_6]
MTVDGLGRELTIVNNQVGRKVDLLAAITDPPKEELTIDGASTLTLVVDDHKRELINDPAFGERAWAVVGGIHYELAGIGKSDDAVTLTLEDAIVAALRRRKKPLSVGANKTTRRAFAARLAREAGVAYSIDPGHPEKVHNPLQRSAGGQKNDSWEVLGSDVADPINWRRFSDGTRLVVGSDAWLMGRYKPIELRENTAGVGSINFDLDVGKRASTASLTIDVRRTDIGVGIPISLTQLGPANGTWLVSRISRALTTTRTEVELTRARHVLKEPKAEKKGRGGRKSNRDKGDPDYLPGQGGDDSGGRAGNGARERMVRFALAQNGKAYVWGGNGPNGYDCSGLVQAATRAAGKTLGKPVSSQWATVRSAGKTIPVSQALRTRGALLFRLGGEFNHVAISLGNGTTVEARGTGYGCGVFGNAGSRGWTGAALWV